MRFISYIILNKPLICNSNAPRIHLNPAQICLYIGFSVSGSLERISSFHSCQIFKEKSCHEPERSKIQPDHAVNAQHPPGVIPRTYPKAFQECSREVFCGKRSGPCPGSHGGRSCPLPRSVPGLRSNCPPISRWAPKRIPIPYIGNMYIDVFPMNFISPAAKPSTEVKKDLKSPSRQTAERKIPDPLSPSAAGAFFTAIF